MRVLFRLSHAVSGYGAIVTRALSIDALHPIRASTDAQHPL
jgi:hypothetical protein